MSDPGIIAAERGLKAVEKRIRAIYKKAEKEIRETVRAYNIRFMRKDAEMRQKLTEKLITESEYRSWLSLSVFRGAQWDAKVNHCTEVMLDANKMATKVIRGEQIGVFAENMTFQAYSFEHGVGANLGFGIYDSNTVSNLLKKQPELLPRRVIDGVKDRAWNKNKIANEITSAIIKGDGIQGIAESLAKTLCRQNDDAMVRYARTAMTAAQNSGRIEMMHEAEESGVKTKKKWIATLDSRTRDAHADLDGQVKDVDEPFSVKFDEEQVEIDYPGDPSCNEPGMVYNCRCTLGYVIEGYEGHGQRRAYNEWDDESGHHRQSVLIEDMTYREWEKWKKGE